MTRMSRAWQGIAFLVISTMLVGLGLAAPQAAGNQNVARRTTATGRAAYAPGDFYLPSSHVFVHVGKTGFGHDHAIIGNIKQATLHLGAEQAAGEIVFDMKTFQADVDVARKYIGLEGTTPVETQQEVTNNMVGPDVLDVSQYPTATFQVTSARQHADVSKRGLPQYELVGNFTLHGVTRPIRLLAEVEMANGWQHVRGGFTLLQTDYKITPFTKAFGAVGVADQLTIWGDIWVAPQAGVPQ